MFWSQLYFCLYNPPSIYYLSLSVSNIVDLMAVDGILTTKHAARFATSYLVFQAVFVIFTISSYLRCLLFRYLAVMSSAVTGLVSYKH